MGPDVNLGELRVQQLQTGPTTLFGFNALVTFDNVQYESSGASAPVPTNTQERLVGLTCEECGKCCESKAGLVAHNRVHGNKSIGADDYSVWFKQTVDCAVSLLESHADSSLTSVDLLAFTRRLEAGITTLEQSLSLLDFHTSRAFPQIRKTVSRRCRQLAYRTPVNRKQTRRANYAAIQTLYQQRRKDAASAVLDGSWKDLYKGNCGLSLDAKQYRKQVLSAPKLVDNRRSSSIRLELDRAHYRRGSRAYDPFNGQFVPGPRHAHAQDTPPVQC
ncbi:hypothetical protein CLF_111892 [Clonorchis sinensis]|uniref:C2H2-type domain-containing protein n=1 Tax=Clonorchis sinensis TaxID=79923 RepID=G7YVI2_CLOSI|nr:hypothetical protein CLF_111892 [Clonorchis sinensis]